LRRSLSSSRGWAALVGASLLISCQQGPTGQTVRTDPGDPCGYARQPLAETGAALARALPGGGSGYLEAKRQETRATTDLAAAIDADAQADDAEIVKAGNALATLTRCRQDQINTVGAALQRREIGQGDARGRYQAIAGALDQDATMMAAVVDRANARAETYLTARASALGEPVANRNNPAPQAGGTYIVKNAANLRGQPAITAPIVGRLSAGQTVAVTGRSADGKWLAVQGLSGTAFVSASLLAPTSRAEARRRPQPRHLTEQFAANTRDAADRLERFRGLKREVDARAVEPGGPTS